MVKNTTIKRPHHAYVRDVYLAYLIDGARRTEGQGFPIIEKWMVTDKPPKSIIQWDRRCDVVDPKTTGMSFYCNDPGFTPILNNPKLYVNKLRDYEVIIGLDASPYDNMPPWVQNSQIGLNLGITYYFGSRGLKVIPNVRLGSKETINSLAAYPHNTLIAIGTNGFIQKKQNCKIFAEQMKLIIDTLEPTGICVYGYLTEEIFAYANEKNIPLFQYDSFTMKRNAKAKKHKSSEVISDEG